MNTQPAKSIPQTRGIPPVGPPSRLVQVSHESHPAPDESHPPPADHGSDDAHMSAVGGQPLDSDHGPYGAHRPDVGVDPLAASQTRNHTQGSTAGGKLPDPDQALAEAHRELVGVDLLAADHSPPDVHLQSVGGEHPSNPPTRPCTEPNEPASGWLELRVWAEMFHDAQQQRIAAVNRAERGGVDPIAYHAYIEALETSEKVCGLHMRRCFRRVVPTPIVAWQKATNGIGEHLLARLLGHLGDPVWATPHHWEGTGSNRVLITDPPFARTVGQLWQYCGHGRPGRAKKGATAVELAALGSPSLKMLVHLCAEACMKTRTSPFRLVYEQTRLAVVDKVHTVDCVRCGPSGKPALAGSPWSPGHQHAHALRVVGKELLRDLWIVAGGGQAPNGIQTECAPAGDGGAS